MIRTYFNQTEQRNGRISQKTLDYTLLHMIQKDANCPTLTIEYVNVIDEIKQKQKEQFEEDLPF